MSLSARFRKIGAALVSLRILLKQRYTVMLIPHSERHTLNFQVSVPLLIFGAIFIIAVTSGFIVFSASASGTRGVLVDKEQQIEATQANLDAILDQLSVVTDVAKEFSFILDDTLQQADFSQPTADNGANNSAGDLSSLLDIQRIEAGQTRQTQELADLAEMLGDSIGPLATLSDVLRSQRSFWADIPNIWPIRNNHGTVTMEFGPNRHPVTNKWYLHKGIDIAGSLGVPVLSSASGKVIQAGYTNTGHGNSVLIRHKYGFRTRYSHLQSIYVYEGQEVSQGAVIGSLGNTGLSTGPHLDFQIILGTDVIDPSLFLSVSRGGFERWKGNRL